MTNFKYQVSRDMSKLNIALEKLLKKTPDQYSCFGCSMGSFCLDGKPVGCIPLEKAMVRAKRAIDFCNGVVYAGDTGIGYYIISVRFPLLHGSVGTILILFAT